MRITFYGNHEVSYSTETHHANSLEQLGHEVIRLQEPKVSAERIRDEAVNSDMFVWTHTHGWDTPGIDQACQDIKAAGVPIVAYHLDLYLGLKRWKNYESDPYMRVVDHWFTVDRLMADWFNDNTSVKGHYLPPGVYGPECYVAPADHPAGNDVIFVGSKGYHPEWPYRPQLINWLRDTYGMGFTHVGGDGDTGTVRGHDLNRIYASSKVVVGDTLCIGFTYPDYWSDRCPETLGRSGFLIHPHIQGMDKIYLDGTHLRYYKYGDFDQLKTLIDYYLDRDEERERIRRQGHEFVKTSQTYSHRWEHILKTVFA